jgi:hypothetical protein
MDESLHGEPMFFTTILFVLKDHMDKNFKFILFLLVVC